MRYGDRREKQSLSDLQISICNTAALFKMGSSVFGDSLFTLFDFLSLKLLKLPTAF